VETLGAGLSVSMLIVLSACGGGGDGGTASIVVRPTTVSGTASKGVVRQAKVLVCRIVDGAPQADASCEVGKTGQNGSFSVALGDGFTGPAMIKVTTSPSSMMLDESTGEDNRPCASFAPTSRCNASLTRETGPATVTESACRKRCLFQLL
jgi:hypothetical protein